MGTRPLTAGVVQVDIAKIIEAKSLHPNAITYDVIVHTTQDTIPIVELVSIEISRDYANNVCDFTLVTFTIPLGTYVKKINPNLDNLEITIITKYYDTAYTDIYKLVILNGVKNNAGSIYSSYSEDELNQMDKIIVEAQCVNRLVEVLRLKPIDGVYAYTTVKKLMKTVITNSIKDIKVEDTEVETSFNMVDPNNDKQFRHINIPIGLKVLDLPTYLQTTDYGVYGSDIGTYVQKYGYFIPNKKPKETVFVYPLYNTTLVDRPGKRLMILSTPTTILSQVENSYIEDGDILKIIGSGDMQSSEIGQTKLINAGSSLITTNTGRIMSSGSVSTDDEVKTNKKMNLIGETLVNKRDGLVGTNYIRPTSNPYKYYSEIARNRLSPYQITWNYSNPELLFPGMPVIYVYEDVDHGVIRLNGILHSVFNKYNAAYKTHVTNLNVLLESYIDNINTGPNTVDVSY